MSFGELALVDGGARSADVIAASAVDCCALDAAAFADLGARHARIQTQLLKNMLRGAHAIVDRLSQEVSALAG